METRKGVEEVGKTQKTPEFEKTETQRLQDLAKMSTDTQRSIDQRQVEISSQKESVDRADGTIEAPVGGEVGSKTGEVLGKKTEESSNTPKEIPSTKEALESFNFSEAELIAAKKTLGGKEDLTDVEIRKQALETQLALYKSGELPEEEKAKMEEIFKKAGLGDVLGEIGIDALKEGEKPELGPDSSPEQIEAAKKDVGDEAKDIDAKISELPAGPEREALEQRRGFLGKILDFLEGAGGQGGINGHGGADGQGFAGVESNGSHNVVGTGKRHLGIHEKTGEADKFLMGMAQSARKTPWCAGFVSYVCKEAGYDIKPTLSSKAFIGETGQGHVGFNVGGGQMLGGNQSDKVSIKPITGAIKGWIMPEDYASGKPAQKSGKAPVGAIIVFDRSSSQRNVA